MKTYEEKYKKALEWMRKVYPTLQGAAKEDAEYVFPELKESEESEDEIIKKAIKYGLDYVFTNNTTVFEATKEQCLAWLEKQGKNNMGISEATKKKLEDNLNKALGKETPESWNKFLDEQGKQKPADKVIEEEKPLLEKFKQAVYDCAWGKVTCKVEGESQEEYANRWAEHLLILVRDWADDYIDNKEDVIARRAYDKGKQDIQKPAWSEDDDKKRKGLIKGLEDRMGFGWASDPFSREEYIDWLKSLKNRYTWKPSELQIEALESTTENCAYSEYQDCLRELIGQLKKLKG